MKIQKLILLLCVAALTTGCSTFRPTMPSLLTGKDNSGSDAEVQEEGTFGEPQKMLVIWKDSVRRELGKPAMRGFGGRIFLYDQAGLPIRAKGELVVYGFDDSVKDREGSKADQKLVFANESFQRRYSKSGLGDSYSIWIDWDEAGGGSKNVTLIPFFRTPDGRIVKAGQSIYSLRGKSADGELSKEKLASHEVSADSDMSNVSQANYVETPGQSNNVKTAGAMEGDSVKSRQSIKTTAINVPLATQRRLREVTDSQVEKAEKMSTDMDPAMDQEKTPKVRTIPSRLEAARKKRREEIGNGNIFGVPGQL